MRTILIYISQIKIDKLNRKGFDASRNKNIKGTIAAYDLGQKYEHLDSVESNCFLQKDCVIRK